MSQDPDELKRKVRKWAEKIGKRKAQGLLLQEGLSFSLATLLTNGHYISEPKERVIEAVTRAMK